jgi:Mn2+/Fe2+ NRAMP family transporter
LSSEESASTASRGEAPQGIGGRLRIVGPGLVLAATTVGIGDFIANVVAGERFGTTFIWAIVLAVVLKYFLTEGLGRWHLASGQTIIYGWNSLGRGMTTFVAVYLVIWAFFFGAAGPSVVGLATNAMFPILSVPAWAVIHSLLAFLFVWVGRYRLFENVMKVLIVCKVVVVVVIAVLLRPDLGELASGLVPRIPDGSLLYAVGIVGGLGGTLALASYGYWVRDKGWRSPTWVPIMRLDAGLGYVFTAVFGVAVLVIGAELLFGTGKSIGDEEGLVNLAGPLGERFGTAVRWIFLAGLWAISFASVIGVWNGMSYLFADIVRTIRGIPDEEAGPYISERSPAYRSFLILLTFPTIPLIVLGQPVGLVLLWTAMGAVFLPFLSITLLWLLNSPRVEREYRNKPASLSNIVLGVSVVIFLVLGIQTIVGLL